MKYPQDIIEHKPASVYVEGDETTLFWLDGDKVMFRQNPIRGADVASFRFYLGYFAKDDKHCYFGSTKLKDAESAHFRALNYTYAADSHNVWTMGGKIADADAASFMVCDDGVFVRGDFRFAYGYGKDNARVYYYDSDGKPNWVKKANPATFKSLNDGHFGVDDNTAFCGHASIAKADVKTWQKLGGY